MLFQSHSTSILLPLAIFKISGIFSKNPSISLKRNPNFELFENFYYFTRLHRQTCCNLMKTVWHSITWTSDIGSFIRGYLANIGLKNAPIWKEGYDCHIFNMVQNKSSNKRHLPKGRQNTLKKWLSFLKLQLVLLKWVSEIPKMEKIFVWQKIGFLL